jgi:cytochrome c5
LAPDSAPENFEAMKVHDQHSSPIKTPKQLIVVVVLAFAVPIAIIALVTQLVTGRMKDAHESDARVLDRIKAVSTVALADTSAPKGVLTGEQVFEQVCKTCHEAGIAGAPKVGDKAAWSARIAQGEKTVLQHAIAGFQGKTGVMPAKGGNADLTDVEVERAVVFMANKVGANWKEPAASAAVQLASAAPIATAAAAPATGAAGAAAAPAAAAGKPDGKKIFTDTCSVCHGQGIAGAPKFGDKALWAPRVAQGVDVLYQHALNGFQGKGGLMPPKGGNTSLSDAEVKAAVDYMVAAAK